MTNSTTATFHFYRGPEGLYHLASRLMNIAVSTRDEAQALFPTSTIIFHD